MVKLVLRGFVKGFICGSGRLTMVFSVWAYRRAVRGSFEDCYEVLDGVLWEIS